MDRTADKKHRINMAKAKRLERREGQFEQEIEDDVLAINTAFVTDDEVAAVINEFGMSMDDYHKLRDIAHGLSTRTKKGRLMHDILQAACWRHINRTS